MRSVAEGAAAAVLAATEIDRAIFFSRVGSGSKTGSLVGPITKRLCCTLTTGAPIVGLAGFDGDWDWGLLSNNGFGHGMNK